MQTEGSGPNPTFSKIFLDLFLHEVMKFKEKWRMKLKKVGEGVDRLMLKNKEFNKSTTLLQMLIRYHKFLKGPS